MRRAGGRALPDLSAIAVAARAGVGTVSPRQRGRHARPRNRSRFLPEPIPVAVPPSERGYIEAAAEPGRVGKSRLWLHGDGSPDKPSSILLTREDLRRLCWFLHRLAESPQMAQGGHSVATPPSPARSRRADHG